MIGASERGLARARKVAAFPGQGVALVKSMYDTHTRLASQFAARIGLDDVTCRALRETYEQWDGKGGPRKLTGEGEAAAGPVLAPGGETVRAPLGLICGARSGDKGGNAKEAIGAWVASHEPQVDRAETVLDELRRADIHDVTRLSVAVREITNLVPTPAR